MWTLMLPSEVLNLAIADLCITYESGRILASLRERKKERLEAISLFTHRVVSWQLQKGHEIATGAGV